MPVRQTQCKGRRPGRGAVVSVETVQAGPFEVELTRKLIKRAYLRVDEAAGPVRVSAPVGMSRADVVAFVEAHGAWIEQRRSHLSQAIPASARRGHVAPDGSVLLWGERVRLAAVSGEAAGHFAAGNHAKAEKLLLKALRERLAMAAQPLVRAYEPVMGVRVDELRIRDMQTRWGTCNVRAHRVWLALSLVHVPKSCLELIVVHELCHLHETGHGARFKALMDRYLPDWRERDALLKRLTRGR